MSSRGVIVIDYDAVRAYLRFFGFAAGCVAVGGFFTNFFGPTTTLASSHSDWFWAIPILVGVSALGFYATVPVAWAGVALGCVTAGIGMMAEVHGVTAVILNRAGRQPPPYGPGFWMLAFGGGVLAAAWIGVMILATDSPDESDEDLLPSESADD